MEKPHWLSISLLPQSITHGGYSTGCTFLLSSLAHSLGATPPNVRLKMEFATFTSPPGDFSAHQEVNKTLPVTTPPPLSSSFPPQSLRPRRCACVVTQRVRFNQRSQIFLCALTSTLTCCFYFFLFFATLLFLSRHHSSPNSVLCMSLQPRMSCHAHICSSHPITSGQASPLAC